MSLIVTNWNDRTTRMEDGIYFPNDEFIELCGTPEEGYETDMPSSIAPLLETDPEGWINLEERCLIEHEDLSISGGATSWEGAGFIAVEREGELLWILQVADSEPFVEVTCDGTFIRAISEEHPTRYDWRIPIDAPEALTVTGAQAKD